MYLLTLPAITYALISPLLLGFAAIGFVLVYFASRYNGLYVLTNNIDTKGAAYAKALNQLMTGVYLSEICLIGLFAINTAPGPIVLMAVFLGATVIYHVIMRHALHPLTIYLPESFESSHQSALFSSADNKSYDFSKVGVPPSEAQAMTPKKSSARKTSLLAKIFSPSKFKSFGSVKGLVPDYASRTYEELALKNAYYNPVITQPAPKLWIVRDEMGISRREAKDSSDVISISDDFAHFDQKGKVQWDVDRLTSVPIWEKRVDY